jgi:hypothetical protein
VFPYWQPRPTEKQLAAAREAREHQLAEHEAAIQRLIEQAHEGEPSPPATVPDVTVELTGWLGELDGVEEVAPGAYRAPIDPDNRWSISGP